MVTDNRSVGVAGGGLLVLAGLAIGYVPVRFLLSFGPNIGTSALVDLLTAVVVLLTGVGVLVLAADVDVDLSPHVSTPLGLSGAVVSLISLFGAAVSGGVAPAPLVGVAGGILAAVWRPSAAPQQSYRSGTTD